MKDTFISRIKDGKFQPSTTKSILKLLSNYEGKNVIITIEKLSAKRSSQQNRFIHLMFTEFKNGLNLLGNNFTMEETKELCKLKFAQIDMFNEDTGEIIGQRIQHTSDMKKDELSTFIDNVISWAANDFHITLHYPNEILTMNFNE